ncbi:MAG: PD40 domain-containing protein [Candidatus Krumholzibacteriota bacterium]|nr:PD40 domain-containing protein [Candidatus Krumholzibacteriota bacterium]
MKIKSFFFLAAAAILIPACSAQNSTPVPKGPYLGQTAPGETPELFAPGIVCTGMDDRDIAISPDGREIFFGVLEKPRYVLVWMKEVDGRWQSHRIAPFSGKYDDYEPQFSPDGNRLYFCSERPLRAGDESKDSDIWYVERVGDGWGEARNLGEPVNTGQNEFYPSITKNGTIYFTSYDMKICRSRFKEGRYSEPEVLSDSINTRAEYNAFIDPDERFLIYSSHSWGHAAGRGDLFVAFRKPDDSWTEPVHLGEKINSDAAEMSPTVSPDGRYLFFSSMRTETVSDPAPVTDYRQLLDNMQSPMNKKMDIYWVKLPACIARGVEISCKQ